MKRPAFSLVELLVVIAIIAVLSAILLPVFWTVRGKARQSACTSNLHQIGRAVQMYMQDFDGRFPRAIDPSDKLWPSTWNGHPFVNEIPHLPLIQEPLLPYTSSRAVWRCPADTGFDVSDFSHKSLNAFPTSYEQFGTSYYYRTELTASDALEGSILVPASINMIFDGYGVWHGQLFPEQEKRYNVLFVDGHVKNISKDQMDDAWNTMFDGQMRNPRIT